MLLQGEGSGGEGANNNQEGASTNGSQNSSELKDSGNESSGQDSGLNKMVLGHRKRAGESTSASRTGFSPSLKKLNSDCGLGLAEAAGQSSPPQ